MDDSTELLILEPFEKNYFEKGKRSRERMTGRPADYTYTKPPKSDFREMSDEELQDITENTERERARWKDDAAAEQHRRAHSVPPQKDVSTSEAEPVNEPTEAVSEEPKKAAGPLDMKVQSIENKQNSTARKLGRGAMYGLEMIDELAKAAGTGGKLARNLVHTMLNPTMTGLGEANALVDLTTGILDQLGSAAMGAAQQWGDQATANRMTDASRDLTKMYFDLLRATGKDDIRDLSAEELDEFATNLMKGISDYSDRVMPGYKGTAMEAPMKELMTNVMGTVESAAKQRRKEARLRRLNVTSDRADERYKKNSEFLDTLMKGKEATAQGIENLKNYFDTVMPPEKRAAFSTMLDFVSKVGDRYASASGNGDGTSYYAGRAIVDTLGRGMLNGFDPVLRDTNGNAYKDENGNDVYSFYVTNDVINLAKQHFEPMIMRGGPEGELAQQQLDQILSFQMPENVQADILQRNRQIENKADSLYSKYSQLDGEHKGLIDTRLAVVAQLYGQDNNGNIPDAIKRGIKESTGMICDRDSIKAMLKRGMSENDVDAYLSRGGIMSLDKRDLETTYQNLSEEVSRLANDPVYMNDQRNMMDKLMSDEKDVTFTPEEFRHLEKMAAFRHMVWAVDTGSKLHEIMEDPTKRKEFVEMDDDNVHAALRQMVGGVGSSAYTLSGEARQNVIDAVASGEAIENLRTNLDWGLLASGAFLGSGSVDNNGNVTIDRLSALRALKPGGELDQYTGVANASRHKELAAAGMRNVMAYGQLSQKFTNHDAATTNTLLHQILSIYGPSGAIGEVLSYIAPESDSPPRVFFDRWGGGGGRTDKGELPLLHPDFKSKKGDMNSETVLDDLHKLYEYGRQMQSQVSQGGRTQETITAGLTAKVAARVSLNLIEDLVDWGLKNNGMDIVNQVLGNVVIDPATNAPAFQSAGLTPDEARQLLINVIRIKDVIGDMNASLHRIPQQAIVMREAIQQIAEDLNANSNRDLTGQDVLDLTRTLINTFAQGNMP